MNNIFYLSLADWIRDIAVYEDDALATPAWWGLVEGQVKP